MEFLLPICYHVLEGIVHSTAYLKKWDHGGADPCLPRLTCRHSKWNMLNQKILGSTMKEIFHMIGEAYNLRVDPSTRQPRSINQISFLEGLENVTAATIMHWVDQ